MPTIVRSLTLAGVLFVSAASATTIYIAPLGLTGDQEVPPRDTPATGTGMAVYDPSALTLSVDLSWSGLTGPAGAAHIHCCPGPGANGPVALDFVPAGFPSVATGTFSNIFDLTNAASYGGGFLDSFGGNVDLARAALITGLDTGAAYFNIHTATYPGGEIRGDMRDGTGAINGGSHRVRYGCSDSSPSSLGLIDRPGCEPTRRTRST